MSFPADFFLIQSLIIDVINVYLSFVMILSVSSSSSSSTFLLISAISLRTLSERFNFSATFSSFSKSLIANQRFCDSSTEPSAMLSISLRASSTLASKECLGAATFLPASLTACSAASTIPSPLSAEISTTSQPVSSASFLIFIWSPFLRTTSIMFTAIKTGIPSSVSCVVR